MTITVDMVEHLVAQQFPHWAGLPVEPVAQPGVDNATFRLGVDMSVRLPRFERWVGQVEREHRWLPHLAPLLPLTVPVPLARGAASPTYPFPWSVYRWLPGDRAHPDRLDQAQAAVDLAGFGTALWTADATGGPPPEWSNGFRGVDLNDDRDSAAVAWRLRERIDALADHVDTARLHAVWQAGLDAPRWDRAPVWVHGDNAPGNLLAVGDRLTAVIDFGTLAVGDPAVDMIAAWTLFDADARADFRAAAGVDDATWARGRVWGLTAVLPAPDELDDAAMAKLDEITG
ncbi:aminoglycoside phosphotransferase [Actinokineospora sp. NBRC 105648]|nr:aminoglycoside phosphotransferase [Actinokineospora sp. NBRC 105648]